MTQQDKPKQQKNKNQNNSNSNNNINSNSNNNNKTNKKKKNSKNRPSLSEDEVNTQSEGHHLCIVCFSSLGTNIRAKLACNHDDICGICHLRLRYLNEDKKCPICKQTNDTIIVDRYPEKKFDDYNRWGDEIGAGFVYKENVGMFFEESYFNESITPLFDLSCHKCDFTIDETTIKNTGGGGKKNRPQRLLMDHLRAKHRLSMCYLCIDHKRDFISQLPKFTAGQLQKHLKEGDGPGSGFSGHPLCEFCHPKRFYDVTFLHQHLNKEHYKCHICEKQGIDNQWFKNYRSLARHFDKQHFMCHDVQCLEARFVVFENELDLRAHELSVHGGSSTGSTKINLEFNFRRANGLGGGERHDAPTESDFNYSLDGQAFVPQALPSSNNDNSSTNSLNNSNIATANSSQLHPQHVQRTEEFRAQAAVVRQQQAIESQGESFPSLESSSASTTSSAPLVGWTSGTVLQGAVAGSNRNMGRVTQESFPALQSSSSNNRKNQTTKVNIAATRRQFSSMVTSANQQSQTEHWRGNVRSSIHNDNELTMPSSTTMLSAAAPQQTNRQSNLAADNFPSLGGPPSSTGSSNRSTRDYSAARVLSRKNFQRRTVMTAPPPSINSASEFPSIQNSSKTAKKNPQKPLKALQPSSLAVVSAPRLINNASNFPSMENISKAARKNASTIPQSMVEGGSTNGRDNFLSADVSTQKSAKSTLEDMKTTLGPKKFKQLKQLTKDFAKEKLSPEGYVEQAAVLFESGYGDPGFWSYLPSLLQSCPNQESACHALKYMNSLKRQQQSVSNQQIAPMLGTGRTNTIVPKKSNGWGSGDNQIIQIASTTQQQPNTTNKKEAKKKKQRNELKDLAYGR